MVFRLAGARADRLARTVSDGDYALVLRNIPVAPDRRWTFVDFDDVLGSDGALASRMHLDFVNGVFDVRPGATAVRGVQSATSGHGPP